MKIAIFTDTYSPEVNGIVTSINTFSEQLALRGHKILIVAPKYKAEKDKSTPGIKVLRYPAISFASNKATRLAFPRLIDLTRELKKFKPDLVHVQTPSNLGVAGIIVAKAMRLPNIQTYHTYLPELAVYFDVAKVFGLEKIPEVIDSAKITQRLMGSDFYDYLMRATGNETLSQFFGFRKKRNPNYEPTIRMLWTYTRWVYNRADVVLTPSESLAKILINHKVKPPVLAQTNGIWLEKFRTKENYNNPTRLIHVGRLGYEKRVDVVILAFAKAFEKNNQLRLDVMGDGPAMRELKAQSHKLGLNKVIKFWGFVKREKIEKVLSSYDLFLTASPMETQGMVILEAMASGLPIVGVKKLAVPEVVKSGRNGYTVPADDSRKMAEMILRITSDSKLAERMGKASVRIAEKHAMQEAVALLESRYMNLVQ